METLRRYLRKGKVEKRVKEYSLQDYDKTYEVTKAILRLSGLRLLREDSDVARLFWKTFYWFNFWNLFVAASLELVNMVQTAQAATFQEAVQIFKMMPCIGYLVLAMVKSYKIVYQRPVYERLLRSLRAMWPQGAVTDEQDRIISSALGRLHVVIRGYYWCNNALLVFFLTPPFVEIIKKALGHDVPLILPFFYWYPFDPFQRVYYEVILLLQTWQTLITVWFMLSSDLLFCIYLSHISTQFDLLSVRLRSLFTADHQPDDDPLAKYNKEHNNRKLGNQESNDEDRLHEELSDIVERHRELFRLSGDVEDLFSFGLLVNFFNSSVNICFSGFCCVMVEKWNEMNYKSFLITALSQTSLLCWYGQRLLESSAGVADALYDSEWYRAPKKIRSSILIMLHRSQKYIFVTTYGFSKISLASYTTIIRRSWSYFTLLLNIYKE